MMVVASEEFRLNRFCHRGGGSHRPLFVFLMQDCLAMLASIRCTAITKVLVAQFNSSFTVSPW